MSGDLIRKFLASTPMSGVSSGYVEAVYEEYLKNPDAVDESWRNYFRGLGEAEQAEVAHRPIRSSFVKMAKERARRARRGEAMNPEAAEKQAAVLRLINYYRVRGHQAANLDPLGLTKGPHVPDLEPAFHGLGEQDMDTVFNTGSLAAEDRMKLRDILDLVRTVYTGSIGAEYMYITETSEKRWIQRRLEGQVYQPWLTEQEQRTVLMQLSAAEGIERYLHTKYVGQKRFSLEGGDSLIPALDELLRRSTTHDVEEVIIGMAHRGRLNVLVNTLGKSPADLFAEFEGKNIEDDPRASGDVKYHMGFSTDVDVDGRRCHLVLAFNPSHLEIVNPVVQGSVRARQVRRGDEAGKEVMPVLIHGDAAFAGQGVVMETLQLSQANGFSTGGTIHLIVNNQIGFTTPNPIETSGRRDSRTSLYCTDIAKMLEAPVFHVNADDPEAVVFITRLAADYRAEFKKDVIIDLVCYRRHGHNEADEPAVTQPQMYQKIRKWPTTRALFAERLAERDVVSADDAAQMLDDYREGLDRGENIARKTLGMVGNEHTVDWSVYQGGDHAEACKSAITLKKLRDLSERLLQLPEGFTVHDRVNRIMKDRSRMAAGAAPLDWGFAETMAYASLIDDGHNVRLTGQDCGRGTFFHRHARLHNQQETLSYTPLAHVGPGQFEVLDTLLSEEGVLGFEYGYATADPTTMVVWEAQFGDFANGAQVVMDQFIASGYSKWGRLCGLTMFLPHGYEGQGPEHSSARLERYLQLCAENNMQVCVPSTPAQMFHMIRRQQLRKLRSPLVVMTPKSLLRHPLSVSQLEDLTKGEFQHVIDEIDDLDPKKVKRVVVCSGKVFFDIYKARQEAGIDDVAIVRLEQLYPFPTEAYGAALKRYPNARDIVWCQEEPENQGAWYQIKHRLQIPLSKNHRMMYATRPGAASTATGYNKVHVIQQNILMQAALKEGSVLVGA
ncbi:2-oxoglutarate dehydrogenase E1 [Oceanococcus atlanticus]|uniref:2-oxoglutarate dehydrogenase E1 component n=1 Tax=Oceanococcus atlanticus TaxID=1317117 RepID=A0A1Y1SD97_9GAMM|nr:2-oxoglutarate dehydrogenase E1 component [Oceanococcus atlanticus]ORE86285.1 2-oxoglutarate dehydrogenase E1 [Oceanococcus atlanticus]